MKALSIDCAISKMIISAKNEDKTFTSIYDIGMKQSESLVPALDYVLEKVGLEAKDLDYCAISIGPGSFTGLRLGLSAVKAIELAYNVPVFGISTLKMHSYCFSDFDLPLLCAIDANKNRFYACIEEPNKCVLDDGDYESEVILKAVKKYKKILVCGPDAQKMKDLIESANKKIKVYVPKTSIVTTDALFMIAENMIENKKESLKDYDGPLYLRASEAEIVKSQK